MESKHKLKIAVFVDWYLPAFKAGGPVKSIANLASQLRKHFDFYIFTSAYDLDGEKPMSVEHNQWIEKDGYRVKYFTKNNTSKSVFQSNLELVNPDVIYINSMFSYNYAIMPIRLAAKMHIKTVLAPRGMLGQGALEIKKHKKGVFLKYFKTMGWHKKVHWHATSEEEKNDIIKVFGNKINVSVIPNIAVLHKKNPETVIRKPKGELKLIFISRISVKKNLKVALELLSEWKTAGKVSFNIYGPIEDKEYYEECRSLASKIEGKEINFCGEVASKDILKTLSTSHMLLLPTKNENYGHIIAESFSVGVPVIISDQTPWKNLFQEGIGYDIPLSDKDAWLRAFEHCLNLDEKAYNEMSSRAIAFYESRIVDKQNVENHKKIFELVYEQEKS